LGKLACRKTLNGVTQLVFNFDYMKVAGESPSFLKKGFV